MQFKNSLFLLFTFLFCLTVNASNKEGFQLPRTKVEVIKDSATGQLYELHIQLPRKYSKDKKYPVVYMTDSPYTFPITVGAARYPVNFEKMENVMFVGISWETNFNPGLSRQRDYTPTPSSPGFKDPAGQADKHLAFIQNDVIGHIEKNYSTDSSRRTYIGNSFGGLFGAYILLTQPNTFHNYVLGSPSLWWDSKFILKNYEKINKLTMSSSANVFISVGANENPASENVKNDMVEDAKAFYSQLESQNIKGLSLKLHIIEAANHETAFPTTAIQGLWWLFNANRN